MTRRETTAAAAMRAGIEHAGPPGPGWPALVLRVTGAGLLLAAGAIHLDLYLTGYLLSVWTGLFGFKEVRTTAGLTAGLIEVAAFAPRHTRLERERAMTYAHAERNLALLRQLEAETRQLLESLDQPDPEQSAWLQEVTSERDDR